MRLSGIDGENAGWIVRLVYLVLQYGKKKIPAPVRIYAYRPTILLSFLCLSRSITCRKGKLPARLRGLAMYWAARQIECAF